MSLFISTLRRNEENAGWTMAEAGLARNRLPPDPVSPRRPALRPEWLKVLFWPQLPSAPEPNSHARALGAVAHMSTDEGLVQAEAHKSG